MGAQKGVGELPEGNSRDPGSWRTTNYRDLPDKGHTLKGWAGGNSMEVAKF